MESDLKLTIFLIIICSIGLTSLFIYGTQDDALTGEPNAFTGLVHSRLENYIMLGITSLMIFTLFWGFIYCAGKSQDS
ncbi:hypothetical protein LCGC14_0373970 [marine sediment metagenome]|uniref:Uncharacterized protein n=1 Tax=marine sediment metagenome TaxID=412755 RepID=A0A0F9TM58_9ZZZZ